MKHKYSYYFETNQMIRDLVHGYVNLTDFELKIIDTDSFQRLKDIRQLTCQEVYPSARHTRFEHSLGVLELTRQAVKHLNKNRFLFGENKAEGGEIFDDQLRLNSAVAALLHDVGHCPFSHLGEREFKADEVKNALIAAIKQFNQQHKQHISEKQLISEIFVNSISDMEPKEIGSIHEQISCLVILSQFDHLLLETEEQSENTEQSEKLIAQNVYIDFELVIRCILGIRYTIANGNLNIETANKYNAIIHLINDKVFDMDKLDYIMRDTVFTGISVGAVDTKRLFRNMYFEDNKTYDLVFSSKAVPALQNFIESRDGLYMYVYNHHAAVLADFWNSYIIRRLDGNADKFRNLVDKVLHEISFLLDEDIEKIKESACNSTSVYRFGLVPRKYLFSVDSILSEKHSDSDWISLVNTIYSHCPSCANCTVDCPDEHVRGYLAKRLNECCCNVSEQISCEKIKGILSSELGNYLTRKILLTYKIISNYKNRQFLKPWWKTLSEFSTFLDRNFKDVLVNGIPHEDIRKNICEMITYGVGKVPADTLRAKIAKLVVYITNKYGEEKNIGNDIMEEGDFFIVERSTRFNEIENIRKIRIYSDLTELEQFRGEISEHNLKSLDNVIPQKDYKSVYNKESFYVYSKPLKYTELGIEPERIFAFAVTKFLELNANQMEKLFVENLESEDKEEAKRTFFERCSRDFLETI